MKESLYLEQDLRLQQRLSAQQVQFVHMLEMSAPEIEDEVRRVVDDNPALIESENNTESAPFADPAPYYRTHVNNYSPDDPNPRDIVNADTTDNIIDSLLAQIGETNIDESDRQIAAYIIGNIDDNGYLRRSAADISYDLALNAGIDIAPDHVQRLIDLVRSLEPAGIAARDLRDCLLLQLNRRIDHKPTTADITARSVIADHFDLFSKKHFDRICSALEISREDLNEALDVIRDLNPKPGGNNAADSSDKLRQITPDFSVENTDDGRVTVTLLNRVPDLAIEKTFIPSPADKQPIDKRLRDAQAFIRRKYDDAKAFISALQRRSETLYAVMEAIVKLQPEFFLTYDRASLRPMILKDVARLTGLDLSVISRATAGKYVVTPAGTFALKTFFSESTPDNADVSVHKILDTLKALIEAENPQHPLSDEALTQKLNEKGFELARRTVTKYRERLRIPVARLRKQR